MENDLRVDAQHRYPVPAEPPTYTLETQKVLGTKKRTIADIFEFTCIAVAMGLTAWLALLLALKGIEFRLSSILWLIVFWALVAYLALPRIHQFFTGLYVPDYFIARTKTGDGLLGDPVNLALDGSEADIHAAMQAAGWVKADEITLGSSWGIIKSSVLRKSYPEAPVSDLFLFNQRHAFAYQQEVAGNAAQRHHIRFWPVPEGWVLPGGHRVQWLAAGTYDRAVGLSAFTGQITHKIDANIDLERDYVINTARYADPECGVEVIREFSTAYHHRNGGGDLVRTDGDLPVLDVTGAAQRNPVVTEVADDPQQNTFAKQVEETKKRRLPPIPFLLVGALLMLTVVLLALYWIMVAISGPTGVGQTALEVEQTIFDSGMILVLALLWLLTLARHRWARIGLMLFAILATVQDLISATASGQITASGLIAAAVSMLVLWSICSDSMRAWVQAKPRRN